MRKLGLGTILGVVVVFCVATAIASHAQTFTSLHVFTQSASPRPVVQGTDGNFYGTTGGGTDKQSATFFKMTPSGEVTTISRFCTTTGCGFGPSGLVQASNENFYGTTFEGGAGADCPANVGGCGTVFEVTPTGKITTLYNFCSQTGCADGYQPSPLIQGINGNFYGTTVGYNGAPTCLGQGRTGCGTVFEITPAGKLTTLHEFCSETNCTDGYGSFAALVLGTDGNFYGTTVYGGANNGGTIFKITPEGTLTTLYEFCAQTNCTDGQQPEGALVEAPDGSFYGTTAIGGANILCDDDSLGCGTIFNITSAGKLTTLYNFCPVAGCAAGDEPSQITLGTDGSLYGTSGAGANNYGTIYELTSSDQFTSLFSFSCTASSCSDGINPGGKLLQATNGTFYGVTAEGGRWVNSHNTGPGVAYSWSMGLGPFVEAQFNFGKVAQIVTILGNNLTGTTSVTFNGTSAKFKVESDTYLKAEVPTGATTGPIEVTTPSGILNSNVAFQVLP